jgi:hypothetical protein
MRIPAACALSAALIAGCGGGAGPTAPAAPAAPANVAGTWSGTAIKTLTDGPACLSRQPITLPATAQITQNGAAVSGILTLSQMPCSFHGTVSGTTINWTQDAQQASFLCLLAFFVPCIDQGGIRLYDIGGQTIAIAGTASGSRFGASGTATSNIFDPTTGHPTGTIHSAVQLNLQRQ